ncbi:hypothetical protein [Salinibius halmophilus]|uniref:hypothetical protein n=1 Tax=Salinibius halmophilus TaxID=1853216 RepID=UPI000E673B48|nr:hypothetical protein [Salinibius halmophilus]
MKESDWKIFKQIKEKAIEKFCSQALKEFEEVITDEKEHVHNRYLLLYKLVENTDKKMALIFDDHSRSKAKIQLIAIRCEGLADEHLLSKLSGEILEQTDPDRFRW